MPGGVETMLIDIINQQLRTEEVSLIIVNNDIDSGLYNSINKDCHIVCCNRVRKSKSFLPWIKLNFSLIKHRPDIIHCHLEGLRKMIFYPAPKVFTIHNTHTSGKEYKKFDALYSISQAVHDVTLSQGFFSTIVHNGIHPEAIVPQTEIKEPKRVIRMVCIGRLYTPHKGQDLLIEALSMLDDRHEYHLDLIGDGPSRKELELLVNNKNLCGKVTFLGSKDRGYIYGNLSKYDLFVQPSRLEGFGLTVAEACCAKVPVLISDLCGPMEIINNEYGYTFKAGDVNDLSLTLNHIFNCGISRDFITDAYNYVSTHFNVERTSLKYIEEYKKQLM